MIQHPRMSYEEADKHFQYHPETGEITRKIGRGGCMAGTVVGTVKKYKGREPGYILMTHNSKHYNAHAVAYLLMTGGWPDGQMDHINGDSTDNRWENLRVVSRTQNMRNRAVSRRNRTGVPGVFRLRNGRYQVTCLRRYLGVFESFFDAACARKSAEHKNGYHLNHGRLPLAEQDGDAVLDASILVEQLDAANARIAILENELAAQRGREE